MMSALIDPTAPVSVFVFGDYHIQARGKLSRPPLHLLRVLVFVLLEGKGKPVLRQHIRELLWSDFASERANTDFRQAMARIRKFQEENGIELLSADPISVWVNPDENMYVDLAEFMGLVASPRPKGCVRMCEIHRGDLLDSRSTAAKGFEDWLAFQRTALFGVLNSAVTHALQFETELTPQERHFCASRLLQMDPCHEGAHRALMSDAAARGQFSFVKQLFDACSKQLRDELGVKPSDETVRHYQELTGRRTKV
jgi:DNA-binding SARP family transcriptional activator